MAERPSAHELMQRELADSATCTCCGEARRHHYHGVLLGCRQGRTYFRPGGSIGLYNGPIEAYTLPVE
jgi:hypothetical protein